MVMNAHMTTRSMFGDQAHSKRRSSPSYGFGSSTRGQAAKVFLSRDHAKLSAPNSSPGPSAYTLRASVGSQADGRKASSPQWVFGSSDRFSSGSVAKAENPGAYATLNPEPTGKYAQTRLSACAWEAHSACPEVYICCLYF